MRVFTVLIHCIVIYPVNSAIHLLNKQDQVTEVFKGLCHVTCYLINVKSFYCTNSLYSDLSRE